MKISIDCLTRTARSKIRFLLPAFLLVCLTLGLAHAQGVATGTFGTPSGPATPTVGSAPGRAGSVRSGTTGSATTATSPTSPSGTTAQGSSAAPAYGTAANNANGSTGNPMAVSSALTSGTAGQIANAAAQNPAAAAAAAQKLGLSPSDAMTLLGEIQNGTLSPTALSQLTQRFCNANLSPTDVTSIAQSLGLSDQVMAQVSQAMSLCHNGSAATSPQSVASPAGATASTSVTAPNGQPVASASPSTIEAAFQQLDNPNLQASIPSPANLVQFGYSVFSSPVSTFAPPQDAPVTNNYVVGPGDEITVMIWGRINETLNLPVQRDGTVLIDQIGPVSVAGLTFGQAKKLIQSRAKTINGVHVFVTMGQIRTIHVFVVGEVAQPGAYDVSALSHISNVLSAAGGVSKVGSLRRIELRRHNQTVAVLDLYNLLLHGSDTEDVRVQDGDVIFVPVIGSVVGVAGDVKRPAIYELRAKTADLGGVLKLAGGVDAFSYTERLQIERVQHHQRMVVLDLPLNEARTRRFTVQDGDLIKVYPVLPQRMNTVTLSGSVRRPGDFQWYKGMRVSDLVRLGQGFMPHTFFKYALLKREEGKQKYQHFIQIDLGKAMAESQDGNDKDILLQPHDELDVYSEDQIRDLPSVWVAGNVRIPGQYLLSPNMKLEDLIYLAGGFSDDADKARVEVARTQVVDGKTRHTYMDVDLAGAPDNAGAQDIPLKNNDQIFVRQAPNWHLPWVVTVSGRVVRPGLYTIHSDERLASVLRRAGGFLPDAFPRGMIFTRASVRAMEQQRLNRARQELSQELAQFSMSSAAASGGKGSSESSMVAMGGTYATLQKLLASAQTAQATGRVVVRFRTIDQLSNSPENLVLDDGDTIDVPRRPESVAVLGQVYNPTAVVARPGLTVRDYLNKAGGVTSFGDKKNVLVIRADGAMVTEEGFENSRKNSLFPMLPLISGNMMDMHLQPGDTVYVPQSLDDVQKVVRMQYSKDMSTIIANSAMSLGMMALLFTKL